MDAVVRNIRLGVRALRNAPAFATAAILTLALGIGLATAVFTVADAVIIRRLPVRDQDRIVVISGEAPEWGRDDVPLSFEDADEYARRVQTLSRVAFFLYNGAVPITVRDGGRVSQLKRALVTGDFFSVLDARPLLGRALRPDDDANGAAPVLVLSHRAWQERFGGDRNVVGRQMLMQDIDVAYTIVGVMPPGVDYPRGTDAWAAVRAAIPPSALGYLSMNAIGRLAPRRTAADARNEMTAYYRRDGAPAWQRDVHGVVRSLPTLILGDTRPAVIAFAAAAALLLLITCINVANLLLVRGLARLRDVAVRAALGAERGRIVAQLLAENALLAIGGGVLGVAVAAVAVRVFIAVAPAGLPRLDEIRVSGAALAGSLGITVVATLLFAVAPALFTSRVDVFDVLRSGARQSWSRGSRVFMEALVAGQIALALLVLSAAGVIGRSLYELERVDLSFNPRHLLIAELSFRADRYATAAQQVALLEQLLPLIGAMPGVTGASPVVSVPYAGVPSWVGRPSREGESHADALKNPLIDIEVVAPSFFATLGLPVVSGRGFTDADRGGSTPVVMLSESAARDYATSTSAIGMHLIGGVTGGGAATVVGVVPDSRYRDLREPHATIYFPLAQSAYPFAPTTLVIRSARASGDLAATLRTVLDHAAPGVALARVSSVDALLAGPLAGPRMDALLLGAFAIAALMLAGVGVFGVLATMVRQRRHEMGIRMALGAAPIDVAWLVLRRGLVLAAAGALTGLFGALVTNRLLVSLLFDVRPTDAATLVTGAVVVVAVAALMGAGPARSSARIEPAEALRAE
ncbi:MAG TPA: ADOP family duplicated permease [Gemmatimonadaceae bacterium]|jgi:predicted permease|nr:ADOP family duplicated permease [Gemmatimonadaceae bacterium]